MDDPVYQGMIQDRLGSMRASSFTRLNEAILWLVQEFEGGEDGNAVVGEIRLNGALVWRRRLVR